MNMTKNFFKTHFNDESNCCADREKFIRSRIKVVEKFIPELAKAFSDYIDKHSKSRDCNDKVSFVLDEYSKAEKISNIFKGRIGEFSNILQDVAASRNAHIRLMETVSELLVGYNTLCKEVKQDLKSSQVAHEKERSWSRQLERAKKINSQDCEQISLAEEEFLKARGEANRLTSILEEKMDIFEKKKLSGMKEALLTWTMSELHFHAKALELFTDAYRIASEIDVNSDLEEFRSALNHAQEGSEEPVERSDSFLRLITLPFQKKTKFTGEGIPHPPSALSSFRSSRSMAKAVTKIQKPVVASFS